MKHLTLARLSLFAMAALALGACASKPEVISTTTTHTTTTDVAPEPSQSTTTTVRQ